jgi:molybdopterin/thiamine biosynthesis adenylyltransferase
MFAQKKDALTNLSNVYTPVFYRTSNPTEQAALQQLVDNKHYIQIFDTIESQLKELMRTNKPAITLTPTEVAADLEAHLNGTSMDNYGVWVYYPWSERLVHILDENEFVKLRTNRNKYKITEQEQQQLFTKRVGVIGLSVGQSVSLTMAIERTFGELRIADFDELEITNLNRLRSGIHNMGLRKTVLVAREIAEIDPFLKVTCFHEGITDDNMEQFLLEGGKLDVLIDECDSVDIKIKCRLAARKHHIPVLMEASDRATIDIERFDLDPSRPILHGAIEHLDISRVKEMKTMEEKLPYILPIVGIETMSPRLKASAIEIGQTISTWPQLASAVTLGGGITADLCRKVLLDQLHVSGRFFIDMDELIKDPEPAETDVKPRPAPLDERTMKEYAAKVHADSIPHTITDKQVIHLLMEAAVLAPSAGNNQPWKWLYDGQRIFLFDDPSRSEAFANFDGMVSNLAMGTALENITLKASSLKAKLHITHFPLGNKDPFNPIAVITVCKDDSTTKDELLNYIATRHTNRRPGKGGQIRNEALEEIRSAATAISGVNIKFLTDATDIATIADISGKAEKLRMFIPSGHRDLFYSEIRWADNSTTEKIKEGLDVRTLDLEPKDAIGFRVIKDERAVQLVNDWNMGTALENMTRKLVDTASAVCLVTAPAFSPADCIRAGMATQRAWLASNKHHLAMQPVMAPIFHFARLIHGNGAGMSDVIQKKFSELHNEFIKLFGLSSASEEPLFLFRLCYADEPAVRSQRLDVDEVYCSTR